ncbi:hypothetical protein F8S09_08135 [Deinococcus sp. SDU3-2]|uniref:Uncharacterized protein n=1 Tax=Deinococcus terrestris TaxID=2651870 RepID=A0A7X1NVX7_9DEIO|nr:hypothetical protein [Deinococcus terrestris]MPY66663.1 hypothetical protein [Deinococcus terrestris]
MSAPPVILHGVSDRSLALLETEKVRLLVPFMTNTCSVSQAGKRCGVSAKRMLYWVNKFLEHGLVVQVGHDSSTNAALYSAVSTSFIVKDLDVYFIEQHIEQQFDPLWDDFKAGLKRVAKQESVTWDFHISLDENATVVRRFVPSDMRINHPITTNVKEVNTWVHLPLRRQEIRSLRQELDNLVERYIRLAQEPHNDEVSVILLHLGMIPSEGPE